MLRHWAIPKIAQVNFDEPLRKPAQPTPKQLDAMTDSLPGNAVAMFKRKIEPLLTRSCFAAGCHNPDSKMPVMRLSAMRVMPRQMSQRNMHGALQFSNAYQPLESPLLKMSVTPHGGSQEPPLKLRSEPFNRLAQWLIAVSNSPMQLHKMPQWMLTAQEIAALEAQAEWEAIQLEKLAEQADEESKTEDEEAEFDPREFEALPAALRLFDPTRPESAAAKGGKTSNVPSTIDEKKKVKPNTQSKDPFDPNEFNRKFGKSSAAKIK